jgi:membrane fusion protein, multidrug efflux system
MALETEGRPLDGQSNGRLTQTAPDVTPPGDKDFVWRQWMMVAVGLVGLLSVLAIIVSVVALASKSPGTSGVAQAATPAAGIAGSAGASGGAMPMGAAAQSVHLVVKSDTEHGKVGTDGKYHDAFLPADFSVHPGTRVTVTVLNYDDMPHTWTATDLNVNQTIRAGSEDAPSKTTFTFTAPTTAGKYQWWCALPCDPYSMSTDGFMRGYVTVKA